MSDKREDTDLGQNANGVHDVRAAGLHDHRLPVEVHGVDVVRRPEAQNVPGHRVLLHHLQTRDVLVGVAVDAEHLVGRRRRRLEDAQEAAEVVDVLRDVLALVLVKHREEQSELPLNVPSNTCVKMHNLVANALRVFVCLSFCLFSSRGVGGWGWGRGGGVVAKWFTKAEEVKMTLRYTCSVVLKKIKNKNNKAEATLCIKVDESSIFFLTNIYPFPQIRYSLKYISSRNCLKS